MLYLKEEDLHQLLGIIWDSTLSLPVEPGDPQAILTRTVAARIDINGAWTGSIRLECEHTMAERAAEIMFGLEADSIGPAECQDAVGELVNMIGGNCKGLLPEPCKLSLPRVSGAGDNTAGIDVVPENKVRLGFCSESMNAILSIIQTGVGRGTKAA
jgi:chemotaxis protein CheX